MKVLHRESKFKVVEMDGYVYIYMDGEIYLADSFDDLPPSILEEYMKIKLKIDEWKERLRASDEFGREVHQRATFEESSVMEVEETVDCVEPLIPVEDVPLSYCRRCDRNVPVRGDPTGVHRCINCDSII